MVAYNAINVSRYRSSQSFVSADFLALFKVTGQSWCSMTMQRGPRRHQISMASKSSTYQSRCHQFFLHCHRFISCPVFWRNHWIS